MQRVLVSGINPPPPPPTAQVDASPASQGSAAGGDSLTIRGEGFVVAPDGGAADDYACRFTNAEGFSLLSARVAAADPQTLVCETPQWGAYRVAQAPPPPPPPRTNRTRCVLHPVLIGHAASLLQPTTLTLVKGARVFAVPAVPWEFTPTWSSASATFGPVSGGATITMVGDGFNTSALYRCRFSFDGGAVVGYSAPALPTAPDAIECETPAWRSPAEGSTALTLLQGDADVLQLLRPGAAPATYRFMPGFVLSSSELDIPRGGSASFTFRPDTAPDGDVAVEAFSSDAAVLSVSSPFRMTAAEGIAGNQRTVSVYHTAAGVATVSLSSRGANYGARYEHLVTVRCKAGLTAAPAAVVMRRQTAATLDVALDTAVAGRTVGVSVVSSEPAVVTVAPASLAFPNGTSGVTRTLQLFCTGVGVARLTLAVTDAGGDALFADVTLEVPVFGQPGLVTATGSLVIDPAGTAQLLVSADTPPTLPVLLTLRSSDPAVASAVAPTLLLPARRTSATAFTVAHRSFGEAQLSVSARSPGLLQTVSAGCSTAIPAACASAMVAGGCDFAGYAPGAPSEAWGASLAAVAEAAAVPSCGAHVGCLRAACCDSARAQECVAAALAFGCNASRMVPPDLAGPPDPAYDFGAAPASPAAALEMYAGWVPGANCQPFVPCAWNRCFGGGGNYDGVESEPVAASARPGFALEPRVVDAALGEPARASLALRQAGEGAVTVALAVVPDAGDQRAGAQPVALVRPAVLTINGSSAANITVHRLRWGRASLEVTVLEAGGAYRNVTHLLRQAISCSPSLTLGAADEPEGDGAAAAGELTARDGAPIANLLDRSNFSLSLAAEMPLVHPPPPLPPLVLIGHAASFTPY